VVCRRGTPPVAGNGRAGGLWGVPDPLDGRTRAGWFGCSGWCRPIGVVREVLPRTLSNPGALASGRVVGLVIRLAYGVVAVADGVVAGWSLCPGRSLDGGVVGRAEVVSVRGMVMCCRHSGLCRLDGAAASVVWRLGVVFVG